MEGTHDMSKTNFRSLHSGFVKTALLWLLVWGSIGSIFLYKAAPRGSDTLMVGDPALADVCSPPAAARSTPTRSIEQIKVGDYVLAKDPLASGPPTPHRVIATPRNWTEHTVHVHLKGGGELQSTREHPFWVAGRGWVHAKDLEAGDQLMDDLGLPAAVSNVRVETRTTDTFNLVVEGVHTYYVIVGDVPVLVHNGYGSYTNYHASGKVYVGKGDAARAAQSAGEKASLYKDPLARTDWTPAANDEDSFLQEEFRMRAEGGPGGNTYNIRNSPGNKTARGYGCP